MRTGFFCVCISAIAIVPLAGSSLNIFLKLECRVPEQMELFLATTPVQPTPNGRHTIRCGTRRWTVRPLCTLGAINSLANWQIRTDCLSSSTSVLRSLPDCTPGCTPDPTDLPAQQRLGGVRCVAAAAQHGTANGTLRAARRRVSDHLGKGETRGRTECFGYAGSDTMWYRAAKRAYYNIYCG